MQSTVYTHQDSMVTEKVMTIDYCMVTGREDEGTTECQDQRLTLATSPSLLSRLNIYWRCHLWFVCPFLNPIYFIIENA